METAIKSIETIYNGYRFRSRLEARWAVFLDSLGVKYEYEPEGFELPDGTRYLPDFRVMCHATRGGDCEPFPLYIEVKGQMDEASAKKIKAFSWYGAYQDYPDPPLRADGWCDYDDPEYRKREAAWKAEAHKRYIPLLIVGDIPNIEWVDDIYQSHLLGNYESLGFEIYPLNYEGIDGDHFAAYPCAENGKFGLLGDDCSYLGWGDHLLTAYAYIAARRARFEHGERPRLVPKDYKGRLLLSETQELFGIIE